MHVCLRVLYDTSRGHVCGETGVECVKSRNHTYHPHTPGGAVADYVIIIINYINKLFNQIIPPKSASDFGGMIWLWMAGRWDTST